MPIARNIYLMLFLFTTAWVGNLSPKANILYAEGFSSQDTMRCKNKNGEVIIDIGASKAKVLVSCGKPFLEDTVTANGQAGEVVVQWTYNFGRGTFFRIITFKEGKVISIHQGDRVP